MSQQSHDDNKRDHLSISIRFPFEIVEGVRRIARLHTRSFNGEVLTILRDYLAAHPDESKAPDPPETEPFSG